MFENKILRCIYCPTNNDGMWRIQTNKELRELFKDSDIVAQININILRWADLVSRKEQKIMIKVMSKGLPREKQPLKRPWLCWQDQIGKYLRGMGAEVN